MAERPLAAGACGLRAKLLYRRGAVGSRKARGALGLGRRLALRASKRLSVEPGGQAKDFSEAAKDLLEAARWGFGAVDERRRGWRPMIGRFDDASRSARHGI